MPDCSDAAGSSCINRVEDEQRQAEKKEEKEEKGPAARRAWPARRGTGQARS